MEGDDSRLEVLLAVALGSRRKTSERRMLPDRRSGVDRRKRQIAVAYERRSGVERRQVARRKIDHNEGATLLQKARSRLSGRSLSRAAAKECGNGLR